MKNIQISLFFIFSLILTSCGNTSTNNVKEENTNAKTTQELEIAEIEEAKEVIKKGEVRTIPTVYDIEAGSWKLVKVYPIWHATTVLQWGETTIYVDPAEPSDSYDWLESPDIIFITHLHWDHLKQDVLQELYEEWITVIVPESVNQELSAAMQEYTTVMGREITQNIDDFIVTTVPAYNIREEALNFHPEDRNDNWYIIEKDDFRVYFSWDSEDTPEMRALENIDVAFVSMNLPYTMSAESAASAVIEFAPKKVFPYHYRGKPDITDTQVFKNIVNESNPNIEVVLHDWYNK